MGADAEQGSTGGEIGDLILALLVACILRSNAI
jgi:hypothetical protein